jgi:hypothetical protein
MKKLLPTADDLTDFAPMPRRSEAAPAFTPALGFERPKGHGQLRLVNGGTAEDPRDLELAAIARHYLRQRRAREARLPAQLFADPAWDTMIDLFASRLEGKAMSVTDACIAACVPPTTALRWFAKMEECGMLVRRLDPRDARRAYLELTPQAADEVRQWLQRTFLSGPHIG